MFARIQQILFVVKPDGNKNIIIISVSYIKRLHLKQFSISVHFSYYTPVNASAPNMKFLLVFVQILLVFINMITAVPVEIDSKITIKFCFVISGE